MRNLLSTFEDERLEELEGKSQLSVAESNERVMLLEKVYLVAKGELKNEVKYPFYLYLVSIAIGILAFILMSVMLGILMRVTKDPKIPQFVSLLLPVVIIPIGSVWAFVIPRKLYDKYHKNKAE